MSKRVALLAMVWWLLAPAGPAPAEPGRDGAVPPPGPGDRCAVCGMFVAPYPNWTAAARFADGAVFYFDGPKDLFRFLFEVPKYAAPRTREQLAGAWVTEYYGLALIPADRARYVPGSDVLGPMGHELVPVAGQGQAETFRKDHGGTGILSFPEITPATLEALR